MLEDYDPNKHNRKSLTKTQLKKTCNDCSEYNKCNALCPQVLAFVKQDQYVRKFDAINKTQFTDKIEEMGDNANGPEDTIEKPELLELINNTLNTDYPSLDSACKSLDRKALSILQKDPRIIAYNNQ